MKEAPDSTQKTETFPVELRSLRVHFHSRWIAFDANAKIALPEFV